MSVEQFNLRIDTDLAQWARGEAARTGCRPRDVVEDALRALRIQRDPIDDVIERHRQGGGKVVTIPVEQAPAQSGKAVKGRAGRFTPSTAAEEPRSARRRSSPAGGDPVAAPAPAEPESRGCPNCGGELRTIDGVTVCAECQTTMEG